MTSAVRTTKFRRGFTLIEIVLVLAIAAVVMGGALGFIAYSSDERELRNASGEIELMAKQARMIAILHQTPHALEFRQGTVRLLPLAQAGLDLSKKSRLRGDPAPTAASTDESRQFALESGISLSIRRWNSDQWLPVTKDEVQVWRFDPDGLCEPITIRLVLDKNWMEDTYHPLNASIRESQAETR